MERSAFGRLVGALVSPVATFRSLAERPGWALAFAVVVLSPLLAGLLAGPKIDWEDVARTQLERSGMDVPARQVEQQVEVMEKMGPFFTYLAPVTMAIAVLMFAAALWGGFTLAGGQPGFKRSLAVTSHAMMPLVVAGLLAVPVVLGVDRIDADQLESGSLLQSSLATFAPDDASPVLVTFLSKLDVFTFWTLVLLVIGFRFAAGVATRTAVITVALLWLLYVGVNVGLAALGAMFAGGGGGS